MALIDAPEYDPSRDNMKRNVAIGVGVLVLLVAVMGVGGFVSGHGWFFSNLSAEHKVDRFYTALEAGDYNKAFGIYNNDADWQQHPQQYSGYPLARFTEDWTTYSPVKAPIKQHQIFVSRTSGKSMFGKAVIVAAQLNNSYHCTFVSVIRSDGTITYPAPYEIGYDKCHNTE